ncbi:DUF4190 domain-containing protein [Cellulosimicrobium protaetiae]|uniref:DUF4190 domain-containing protein n=1 Tax=Cellulosimicrobium protaetiae TaxID=2587808 RepID=A0A6M5UAV1_9MICO|nr:DUF4190 domain-containing protein [Cellulosimicrobium protaetiae]QJW35360.1 hypothetical protein FIC82_003230 [Cellulosimicrobium protaetiae]
MTQQYPAAPQAPAGYAAPIEDPGKTLGIVGFVFAFIGPLLGLIFSIIARNKSKAAGFDNQLAKWGVILSSIFLGLYLLFVIIAIAAGAFSASVSTY